MTWWQEAIEKLLRRKHKPKPKPPSPRPPIPPQPKPPSVVVAEPAPDLVQEVNLYRIAHGLGALVVDQRCVLLARRWSLHMAETHDFGHGDFGGRAREFFPNASPRETIAAWQLDSGQVVRDWDTSPGHKMTMLHPAMTVIGAGKARAIDGRNYWCAVYA
jgi:uncharacterized protein YkwD